MKKENALNRVKNGEILTFCALTKEMIVKLGWNFEQDEEFANFYLDYHNRNFRLCGTAKSNDCYVVEGKTESMGGIEGIEEIMKIGDPTFDYFWIGQNGFVSLQKA